MESEPDRLARDIDSPEFLHGAEQGFWEFDTRDKNFVYVRLNAPDGRVFMARLDCASYWEEPICCEFVDPEDRTPKQSAWPNGNQHFEQWIKFRNAPHFICWDQDRAGIARHPEWKAHKAWQKRPNQIVAYLDFLRQTLYLPIRGYTRQN